MRRIQEVTVSFNRILVNIDQKNYIKKFPNLNHAINMILVCNNLYKMLGYLNYSLINWIGRVIVCANFDMHICKVIHIVWDLSL